MRCFAALALIGLADDKIQPQPRAAAGQPDFSSGASIASSLTFVTAEDKQAAHALARAPSHPMDVIIPASTPALRPPTSRWLLGVEPTQRVAAGSMESDSTGKLHELFLQDLVHQVQPARHRARSEEGVDLAIADFNQALRRDPKDTAALTDRGNAWFGTAVARRYAIDCESTASSAGGSGSPRPASLQHAANTHNMGCVRRP